MNWLQELLKELWNFIFMTKDPVPTTPLADPVPQETEPPMIDRVGNLERFAEAQRQFEGWFPGSSSFRHNNPGNCKGINGQFLTFKTEADGFQYLKNYILRVKNGQHAKYPKGGDTNISEYTHIYTSDPEPSPTNYANAIARALKTFPSTKLRDLV